MWQQRRTLAILIAFQAILGLGMLEFYYVIHQIYEPDCPTTTTGNPNDCYFCSHLSFIALESTPGLEPPRRPDAQVAVLEKSFDRPCSGDILDTPARSPPASL